MTTTRVPALLILSSTFLAAGANGVSMVAFPWLVLQRTGSAVDASIVAGAATLPLLFATLIAGAAVDFVGRRRVAMLSDALSATAVAAIPVLAIAFGTDVLTTVVLAALAALGAFFDPAGMTARQSMLPEAAGRAGWTLDHTNSVYEAVFNLAYITGPGVGGLLIATLGGVNAMWVTAALFGLAILAMAVLRLEGTGRPAREKLPESVVSGVLEGLTFVWRNRVLRTLGLVDLAVTGLYLPMESVLFPKYFTDRSEPAQLGWVLMALSIGGLVGALSWTVLSKVASKRATVLTAVLTFGIAVAVIAFLPPLPVILSLAALVGLVYGPIGPIYNSIVQTRTPEQLRGRVVGVMTSMTYAAGPIGFMLAGPLVDAFGLTITFLVLAVPILAIGMVCPWLPALKELDDDAPRMA
ncbi:MFS transporter [Mycolicibacterium aromaticivorans JS19b1 = JCM 16368]|uniref:Multidrug efflux pump Tap n=1 Tax=Mycolicibacterium aromaticivorans JS19b1 = JCM 16368 TaxID=1440774 RepID=A0A064CKH6_9MYCO|nr:MFS transporter [Mycolicibacterium aromaticivorans]KDF01110.1 MFS transporter [Mycolicibacterium aromaticivorans JS19b1 = JCM 16368]